jgi:hypothetical protein
MKSSSAKPQWKAVQEERCGKLRQNVIIPLADDLDELLSDDSILILLDF